MKKSSFLVPFVVQNLATLKTINLENNELTSVGLERLLNGIQEHAAAAGTALISSSSTENVHATPPVVVALQELLLTDNRIGSRGAKALLNAKDSMPQLQKLTLDDNGIPDCLVEELQQLYGDVLMPFSEDYDFDYDYDEDLEDDELDDDEEEEDEQRDQGKIDNNGGMTVGVVDGVVLEVSQGLDVLTQNMGKMKLTPDDVSL